MFLCHSFSSAELSLFGQYNYNCIVATAELQHWTVYMLST